MRSVWYLVSKLNASKLITNELKIQAGNRLAARTVTG